FSANRLNLNQAGVKRWSRADISKNFRGKSVDALSIGRETGPVQPSGDNSGLDGTINVRAQPDLAPDIEHTHPVSFPDIARRGVCGVDLQQLRMLHFLHGLNVAKARVQEIISLAREQLQGESARFLNMARLAGRHKGSNGIQPLGRQRFAVKFSFTAGRGEASLGVREERSVTKVEPYVPFTLQSCAVNSFEPTVRINRSILRAEHQIHHLVVGVTEAFLAKAHLAREFPKQFTVGFALAQRSNGLIGNLDIAMPVSRKQIFVFKERGGRQHYVCVVYRVSEKLLMHYGKEVRPQESADHIIVAARYHRRISVVNED